MVYNSVHIADKLVCALKYTTLENYCKLGFLALCRLINASEVTTNDNKHSYRCLYSYRLINAIFLDSHAIAQFSLFPGV